MSRIFRALRTECIQFGQMIQWTFRAPHEGISLSSLLER